MRLLIFCAAVGGTLPLSAQVKIGGTPEAPASSAILELSSDTRGLLLPRLTDSAMRNMPAPSIGLVVFNRSDSTLYMFGSSGWNAISSDNKTWRSQRDTVFTSPGKRVGINTTQPTQALSVNGHVQIDSNIYLPNSISTGVGVIYKNGVPFLHNAGLMSQQNVYLGAYAGSFHPLAKKNVAIGSYALANSDGADNIAVGYSAGKSLIGGSSYTASYKNLFVGYLCGELATGGVNNIAVGNMAGYVFQHGSVNNIVIGDATGKELTTGIGNSLIGANVQTSTGLLNTGMGANSGMQMRNGSYNTWLGANALQQNKSGQYNTVIGTQAGTQDSLGSFNVFLGAYAATSSQGSLNVVIGSFAGSNEPQPNLSNKLIIQNSNSTQHLINGDFTLKRVGIAKPLADLRYTLDVGGEIRVGTLNTPPTPSNGVMYYDGSAQKMKVFENGSWNNLIEEGRMIQAERDPRPEDITAGGFKVWKNNQTGQLALWVNDGGVMRKVVLE